MTTDEPLPQGEEEVALGRSLVALPFALDPVAIEGPEAFRRRGWRWSRSGTQGPAGGVPDPSRGCHRALASEGPVRAPWTRRPFGRTALYI
jgi:hypothetical protein